MKSTTIESQGLFQRFRSLLGSGENNSATPQTQYFAKIFWRVIPGKVPGYLVCVCDELGLVIGGKDREELLANVRSAMALLVEDLVADDNLEEYFHERGVEFSKIESTATPGVNIPCYLFEEEQYVPRSQPSFV